jgi:hypothetical protein
MRVRRQRFQYRTRGAGSDPQPAARSAAAIADGPSCSTHRVCARRDWLKRIAGPPGSRYGMALAHEQRPNLTAYSTGALWHEVASGPTPRSRGGEAPRQPSLTLRGSRLTYRSGAGHGRTNAAAAALEQARAACHSIPVASSLDLSQRCLPLVQITGIDPVLQRVHGAAGLVRAEDRATPAARTHRLYPALAGLDDADLVIHTSEFSRAGDRGAPAPSVTSQ